MNELILDLPNGAKLKALINSDESWKSIDINIVYPDGTEEVLCAADYDSELGLRVIGMGAEQDDYKYCEPYPIRKSDIYIVDETKDDGTYDIVVRDNWTEGDDEELSQYRIASFVEAIDRALVLMEQHKEIRWNIVGPGELAATVDNKRRAV